MIRMNDFRAEPPALLASELAAAERVLRSGWYVLGSEVKTFEAAWARRCGTGHCVGVGNGMDAIEIGLRALEIGVDDEVITTSMTAFASVLAILRAGATPVLADIDPQTALLDPASVERCIGRRTKAILLVHLYGQVRDMDGWTALCERHGIALLEDCAQAHLAKWNERSVGAFGRFGAYSFYPTKNLGALGDGGALVTDDAGLAEQSAVLRNYGQSERYHHPVSGLNSRLDELQAALLTARLDWLDRFTKRRGEIAMAYQARIRNPSTQVLADPLQPASHVYHLFVILCDERDRLAKHLLAGGIEALIHYPLPCIFRSLARTCDAIPMVWALAERHASRCLSIPCHPQMSDADVDQVIDCINAFR